MSGWDERFGRVPEGCRLGFEAPFGKSCVRSSCRDTVRHCRAENLLDLQCARSGVATMGDGDLRLRSLSPRFVGGDACLRRICNSASAQ